MWQSFHSLLGDSSTNSQKILEWRVLQSGGPLPLHRHCASLQNAPIPAIPGQSPRQGPAGTWPHPSQENKARKSPCLSPRWWPRVLLRGWAGDKRVCSRYRTPRVKGFRSHWQIILQADATGLLTDWAAHKVSVSRSDPKNRLLDASQSGWVCGRHTPHRPAPPDPARTQCAQVRPSGGETGISLGFSQVFFGVPGVGIRGSLPIWSLEQQRPADIFSV